MNTVREDGGIEKLRSKIRKGEHLRRDFSELKDFIPKVSFFFFMALRLSSRRDFFLVKMERKDSTSR